MDNRCTGSWTFSFIDFFFLIIIILAKRWTKTFNLDIPFVAFSRTHCLNLLLKTYQDVTLWFDVCLHVTWAAISCASRWHIGKPRWWARTPKSRRLWGDSWDSSWEPASSGTRGWSPSPGRCPVPGTSGWNGSWLRGWPAEPCWGRCSHWWERNHRVSFGC